MIPAVGSRAQALSRRHFLWLVSAAGFGARPDARPAPEDVDGRSALERLHVPVLRLPTTTRNGAKVPIVVEISHPMEPEHGITRLEVSPSSSQGAHSCCGPASHSKVAVTAECTRHGRWSSAQAITVVEGEGGCADAPLPARTPGPDIRAPRIRIPQLVREGRIRRDELIDVQVAIRHPSRTGLALRQGGFVQQAEPFYLARLEVFYGAERVSHFVLTSAVSDDPFITFRLRAGREEPLKVLFTNSRGQRFDATHPIRLS